jgi:hypothetical protein
METLKKEDYHATLKTGLSLGQIEKAISNVAAWWTENVKGSAGKLNDEFTVYFGETFVKFRITEYVSEEIIVWTVTDCHLHWLNDKTEWTNTHIVWELSKKDGQTQVDMTHLGLRPQVECYDTCVKGWDQYVKMSLFELLNTGKGKPERRK